MKNKIFLLIFVFILSCQPIEKIEKIVFDNNQLSKFNIVSKLININIDFEVKISDPYIGHTLNITPAQRNIFNKIGVRFHGIPTTDMWYLLLILINKDEIARRKNQNPNLVVNFSILTSSPATRQGRTTYFPIMISFKWIFEISYA